MAENERENRIDPYTTLDISPEATSAEVRLAYLQKLRQYPPERDPEGFKRVREAYEVLRSPRKRAELTLLELRQGPAEFDLDRLCDEPLPPLPQRLAEHLLAIVLAEVDAAIDAGVLGARRLAALPPASESSSAGEASE